MPAEITTGWFCASYYGVYEVPGSKRDTFYEVSTDGTGMWVCTCPAFRYARKPNSERTCKHMDRVFAEACMANCQWHEGNKPVLLRPVFTSGNTIPGQACENCGGPVVAVRIAV